MNFLISLFRNLFQKKKIEREAEEELSLHLEMQMEENMKKGMDEAEARRQAALQLGGYEQVKERIREARAGHSFETFIRDLRYAIRSLLREPGLLVIVVLTLAIAIGANTAIFSVAESVLLRSLPYSDPDRLVMVWLREKDGSPSNTNYATYQDWRTSLRSFESIAVTSYWQPTLSGHGEPLTLEGTSVSVDYFRTLGVRPLLGRAFLAEEDRPERNRVVVLSHHLWRTRFQSDASIIGKQILLSGYPRTVVGVMPARFRSLIPHNFRQTEIWRPLGYDESLPWACRTCNHLTAVAKIRSGITRDQAASEIDAFTGGLIQRYPADYGIAGASLVPLQEQFVGEARTIVGVLLFAVTIVLLIACANIAGLMLARATRRQREFAIRAAIGAGTGRLIRQLITESLLLSSFGGCVGVLLAYWTVDVLIAFAPQEIPRFHPVSINATVALFAAALTVIAGLLFGVAPAWQASRLNLQESLQDAARSTSSGHQGLRKLIVVFNLALALVLLTGAGLILQSIRNLMDQKLGFRPDSVITMSISVAGPKYEKAKDYQLFFQETLRRVHAVAGVQSAGIVSLLPLSTNLDMYGVRIKDKPLSNPADAPSAERYAISPGYVKALRIPVLRGRSFTEHDRADTMPVVLVNRTFAERIWSGENPIGKQVHIGAPENPWRTVVGVLEDVRHRGLQEPFAMQLYLPYEQWEDNAMTLVIRTGHDPKSIVAEVQRAVWSQDASQPISNIATMKEVVESSIAQRKFVLTLLELFAITALLLSALGIYGVMAYMVTRRVREIGIRVALGANHKSVIALIMSKAVSLVAWGILVGIGFALVLTRFLQTLLFDVHPFDPVILFAVMAVLFAVGCFASFMPAFRASRLNPVEALRAD